MVVVRDSSVSVATHYGLNGPEIEYLLDVFHTCPYRSWSPPSLQYNEYRVNSVGKAVGRGVNHPPPSSTEVKERVDLYYYSPSLF